MPKETNLAKCPYPKLASGVKKRKVEGPQNTVGGPLAPKAKKLNF